MTGSDGVGLREPGAIVRRLGGHPARALGLDPARDEDLGPWWVAALLLGERGPETRAQAGFQALHSAGLAHPTELTAAGPGPIATALAAAGLPRPEVSAARLLRSSRQLTQAAGGSLVRLAGASDDLEELGARLGQLGPGVGPATLHRFLAPLRDRFAAAADLPLHPAALRAAQCLGWLDEHADPSDVANVAALRARHPDTPWTDLEAALARLGAVACRRKGQRRCPLGAACAGEAD